MFRDSVQKGYKKRANNKRYSLASSSEFPMDSSYGSFTTFMEVSFSNYKKFDYTDNKMVSIVIFSLYNLHCYSACYRSLFLSLSIVFSSFELQVPPCFVSRTDPKPQLHTFYLVDGFKQEEFSSSESVNFISTCYV
ncbi:hypothetical protein L2E82_27334 [Cichorium intybus]|uniref:Uncharacterized protein n=1 Tax=Cichorium intybus TaxID=13427 RepID=A0ACB9CSW9_CICIN|nr:hypothetical protein L2E82_27334 [Cichorium intybus]